MKLLESKEFKKAYLYGYTKSQGGMNMPELMKIARGVGVDPSLTRKKMLELIYAKKKDKTKKAGGVVERAKDAVITKQEKRIEKRVNELSYVKPTPLPPPGHHVMPDGSIMADKDMKDDEGKGDDGEPPSTPDLSDAAIKKLLADSESKDEKVRKMLDEFKKDDKPEKKDDCNKHLYESTILRVFGTMEQYNRFKDDMIKTTEWKCINESSGIRKQKEYERLVSSHPELGIVVLTGIDISKALLIVWLLVQKQIQEKEPAGVDESKEGDDSGKTLAVMIDVRDLGLDLDQLKKFLAGDKLDIGDPVGPLPANLPPIPKSKSKPTGIDDEGKRDDGEPSGFGAGAGAGTGGTGAGPDTTPSSEEPPRGNVRDDGDLRRRLGASTSFTIKQLERKEKREFAQSKRAQTIKPRVEGDPEKHNYVSYDTLRVASKSKRNRVRGDRIFLDIANDLRDHGKASFEYNLKRINIDTSRIRKKK